MLHSARNRRFAGVKVIQGLSHRTSSCFEFTFQMPTIVTFIDLSIPNQARTITAISLYHRANNIPVSTWISRKKFNATIVRWGWILRGYFRSNRFRPNYERAGSSNSLIERCEKYRVSLSIDNNPGIISQRSFFYLVRLILFAFILIL